MCSDVCMYVFGGGVHVRVNVCIQVYVCACVLSISVQVYESVYECV